MGTIDRLDDPTSKAKIAKFKGDHERHVAELTRMASTLGVKAQTEGDAKQYLTTGKIALASIIGDRTILKAMSTNEIETRMACDHAARNGAATPEAQAFFRTAYDDEARHKAWMDSAASRDDATTRPGARWFFRRAYFCRSRLSNEW